MRASSSILTGAENSLMHGNKGKRPAKGGGSKVDPAFDPISAALRQMHDEFASEPIPDDFMRLLDQIDARMSGIKKPS